MNDALDWLFSGPWFTDLMAVALLIVAGTWTIILFFNILVFLTAIMFVIVANIRKWD
jgi:hypothetical protein